jgi:uncharacterized phage-associated protein
VLQVVGDYYGKAQKRYLPLRRANLDILKSADLEIINAVIARLSDKNATEISEYSHDDAPWANAVMGELLDYSDVRHRSPAYKAARG